MEIQIIIFLRTARRFTADGISITSYQNPVVEQATEVICFAQTSLQMRRQGTRSHFGSTILYIKLSETGSGGDTISFGLENASMSKLLFDFSDGDIVFSLFDSLAMDSDGNMMMRMGDTMAMDMDSGELHITSSWASDDEDNR